MVISIVLLLKSASSRKKAQVSEFRPRFGQKINNVVPFDKHFKKLT